MSRSRSQWPADWPVTPNSHPEFGYLRPSPRRLRRLRFFALAATAVMAIGATMGLAAAHRGDEEDPAPTVQADVAANPMPPSASAHDASPISHVQESCKMTATRNPAGAFLSPTCRSSKLHARHGAQAEYRVAIVILGRTNAPAVTTDAAPKRAAESANQPTEATTAIEKPTAISPAAGGPATPHLKPKTAPDISLARAFSRQDAMANAYAYAPQYDSVRPDLRQSGFGSSFGIW
jgi:hypothetical protein